MSARLFKSSLTLLVMLVMALLFLIHRDRAPIDWTFLQTAEVQTFKTLFISIMLEAFPFILLGVILSSLLHVYVGENLLQRILPKRPLAAILFACFLGVLFPVCECGMIPVIRKLLHKGMPVYVAVVFILTGPIINPVVFASTYMAFRSWPEMVYARMGLAFVCAAAIGLLLYRYLKASPLRHEREPHHGHHHAHGNRISALFSHASDEFFEMGKYLLFGAAVTAGIQTFLARDSLAALGQGPITSHLFMMGFAFVLSLCSTSDAFVASSFMQLFSKGSLLTFLVFGPMLDIKGAMMLLSVFKTRFVLLLSILIAATVLCGSLLIQSLHLFSF